MVRIEACHEALITGGTGFAGSDLPAGLLGATMTLDVFMSHVTTAPLFVNDMHSRLLDWKLECSFAQGVEER